jgi:hypothetical protein
MTKERYKSKSRTVVNPDPHGLASYVFPEQYNRTKC